MGQVIPFYSVSDFPGQRDRLCLMPWHPNLPKLIQMEQHAPELGESLGTVSFSARLAVGSFQKWSSPTGEFQCLRDHFRWLKDVKYSCTLKSSIRNLLESKITSYKPRWRSAEPSCCAHTKRDRIGTIQKGKELGLNLRSPMDKKFQNRCSFVTYPPLIPSKAMQTSPALCLHVSYSSCSIRQWMMLRSRHIINEFWTISNVF